MSYPRMSEYTFCALLLHNLQSLQKIVNYINCGHTVVKINAIITKKLSFKTTDKYNIVKEIASSPLLTIPIINFTGRLATGSQESPCRF